MTGSDEPACGPAYSVAESVQLLSDPRGAARLREGGGLAKTLCFRGSTFFGGRITVRVSVPELPFPLQLSMEVRRSFLPVSARRQTI